MSKPLQILLVEGNPQNAECVGDAGLAWMARVDEGRGLERVLHFGGERWKGRLVVSRRDGGNQPVADVTGKFPQHLRCFQQSLRRPKVHDRL